MATFRNSQLEEILNNERSMNRVILDRTSAHIASIGDDKAPPTQRDIKLEATLGALIDGLKEKINKAIQLISPHQYGGLDEKKVERLLSLDKQHQELVDKGVVDKYAYKDRVPIDLGGTKPRPEDKGQAAVVAGAP
jgi:hypothetical protein